MKKLLGICICLLIACVAIVSTLAVAETNTTENIIHFMSPIALAMEDDMLYVADNVEAGKGVIHSFDLSGNTPQYVSTIELKSQISNISVGNGVLYAMAGSKVYTIRLETDEVSELTLDKSLGKIIDAVVYKDTLMLFAETGLSINGTSYAVQSTSNPIACIASGEYLYYLYGKNPNIARRLIKNSDGIVGGLNDTFNSALNWVNGFQALGMFAWDNGEVAIFGEHAIYKSVSAGAQYNLDLLATFNDFSIKDAEISNDKLCVLTRNNQVKIFSKASDSLTGTEQTIGSDTLDQDVPTEYTSFTLVKSKGYPTNIVFKTTGAYSIEEIVTDATEYIVLGYLGDENSNYYYVLLGDKFGWVKKSETANTVEEDTDRLEIIDTTVSDGNFTTSTKFVSMDAIYVSPLPRQSFYDNADTRQVYTQSANDRIDVTVWQKFTEGQTTWYYVSFEANGVTHKGFVLQSAIKEFKVTGSTDGVNVIGQRKINSALFSTVKVYDESMTGPAYGTNGKQIKPLSSGTKVILISEKDGVAFIQILKTGEFGYVHTDELIGVNKVTTNAAVGTTLIVVAIALGVTLTVLFIRRKNRKKSADTVSENK